MGPAIQGSSDVLVNNLPALRDTDPGIHAACCGPNQWSASGGAPSVFINGKKAFRQTDMTRHCGGSGALIQGSPTVLVGNSGNGGTGACMKEAAAQGAPFVEMPSTDL